MREVTRLLLNNMSSKLPKLLQPLQESPLLFPAPNPRCMASWWGLIGLIQPGFRHLPPWLKAKLKGAYCPLPLSSHFYSGPSANNWAILFWCIRHLCRNWTPHLRGEKNFKPSLLHNAWNRLTFQLLPKAITSGFYGSFNTYFGIFSKWFIPSGHINEAA